MKTRLNLVLLVLLVLLISQTTHSIDINNANCDQIEQCDSDGLRWSAGSIACETSTETTPDPEQVFVTPCKQAPG